MKIYGKNVTITERMRVVGITEVALSGVLSDNYDEEVNLYGWALTDEEDTVSLSEWLDAFEGKNVVVTIKLVNRNDDGVSVQTSPDDDDDSDE